ncbi:embryogenesis-associated protein EMB8-like isoform X1 [Prosopis cineraria]|uniref:embryogenesis-associated protein EMB8-like isoform X1 n=1 Tax=Prosopis cineraria TaxID=364024 RepID=UPI002410505E|nr:embryogenesis-associated protein EMB8-like isoform X1 [Prosopis cineraria]
MSTPQPHSSFEVIGGARDRFLHSLSYLSRPFSPFPYIASNRHVETIFASFFRSAPKVRYRRQCIRTKDGGVVAVDWVSGDDRLLPPDSPVLILLPGLTGGSEASYARHLLIRARSKGWRVVVFNNRGCGNSPVITPQLYSASFLGDLREVISHVNKLYPDANIYAVGWSLGANILVRYLGQETHACPLSGAVSLCNPFNLVLTDDNFHKGFNNVYDRVLAKGLRKNFKKHALLFEDIGGEYNIELAINAKSIREYDDGLTRVSFGFKSVDEYYSNSSSADSIKHVQIPLLCVQAANDPIAPSGGIPREDIKENPNCLLIVTPKGGHLGWVAGDDAPFGSPWPDPLVIDFLEHLESGSAKSGTSWLNPEGNHQSKGMASP